MKYISRSTKIQIGNGEIFAVGEIEVSEKRRPAAGVNDGMGQLAIQDETVSFYEMDWRTTVKVQITTEKAESPVSCNPS